MSTTLYRKYRPQVWKDLTNQNHIKITIQNEVVMNRVSHAYLLVGPRGVGKTTTARLLAKTVNCLNLQKDTEPCNICENCIEIVRGNALDLIEIDAASHTGVDNVRENIIENSKIPPIKCKYKIFIIDEVHMLSTSAFNALLKIIEEPPINIIFVLATTNVYDVPDTVISRCQRFNFSKVTVAQIVERLKYISQQEHIDIDSKVLLNIAIQSDGSVRDSESVLGQVFALGEHKITEEMASLVIPKSNLNLVFELLVYILSSNTEKAIKLVNQLVSDGININLFIKETIEITRELLLIKCGAVTGQNNDNIQNIEADLRLNLMRLLEGVSLNAILRLLTLLIERLPVLSLSPVAQLPLEMIIIEFHHNKE